MGDETTIGVLLHVPADVYQAIKRVTDDSREAVDPRGVMVELIINATRGAREAGQRFADWCRATGRGHIADGQCTQAEMQAAGRAYRQARAALSKLSRPT